MGFNCFIDYVLLVNIHDHNAADKLLFHSRSLVLFEKYKQSFSHTDNNLCNVIHRRFLEKRTDIQNRIRNIHNLNVIIIHKQHVMDIHDTRNYTILTLTAAPSTKEKPQVNSLYFLHRYSLSA